MEKYYRNQQIIDGELDNHQVMMHIEKGKYFGLPGRKTYFGTDSAT